MTKKITPETDNLYFLKVLLYFVLGMIWVKYQGRTILPVGFILGIVFAQKDHFSIDRKIEYVVLLIAAALGLAGIGLYLNIRGLTTL